MGALVQGEAQRRGHQLLLLGAEISKGGVGRWRGDRAPLDLVVAVVGHHTLCETLHLLEARVGVVVEEVLDGRHLDQDELVGIGFALRQNARLDRLDLIDEPGHQVALCRGQVRPAGVHVRAGHIVAGVFGAVFPKIARHGVVVKHIAQVLGHHQLLRASQVAEGGVGGRRIHTRTRPVDLGIVVVCRSALQQGAAHLEATAKLGSGEHHAGVFGIASVAGDSVASHQGGGECASFGVKKCGGALARLSVNHITQCGRYQVFLRFAERAKAHLVDRAHHQVGQCVGAQSQARAHDQGFQRRLRCADTRIGTAQATRRQIGQSQLDGDWIGQLRIAASGHAFDG